MKKRFGNIAKTIKIARKQNVTLRARMMLYLISMLLAAVGITVFVFVGCGMFWNEEDRLSWELNNHLDRIYDDVTSDMDECEGYAYNLSQDIGGIIEDYMSDKGKSIDKLNDSSQGLLELQEQMYGKVYDTYMMAKCNGVYVMLDATANTGIEDADNSRSGIYIRKGNGAGKVAKNAVLYRGNAILAKENGVELHTRWNPEFDINDMTSVKDGNGDMIWSDKEKLSGTWEDIIQLKAPVTGSDGQYYGICGVDLNSHYFQSKYLVRQSQFGTMITVIAPVNDNVIELDRGMTGDTEGTWLGGTEELVGRKGKKYITYNCENGSYLGVQKELDINGAGGKKWAVGVIVLKSTSMRQIHKKRITVMIVVALFVAAMILLACYLSRKFVKPIIEGFEDIKEDGKDSTQSELRIAEIEELKEFVLSRKERKRINELPEKIEEMLVEFKNRTELLTPTEHIILNYYVKDYVLDDIAKEMYISIGTAKKHNTNMNKKLDISTRSQLMVYIELFKRCNRLEDIVYEPT